MTISIAILFIDGGNVMCEVLEIGGRAVTDIQYGNDFTVILTEGKSGSN